MPQRHPAGRVHDRVDGNVAAGPLSDVFGIDITMVVGTCRHCGASAPLAEAVVEIDDEGLILLCRTCEHTMLTFVSRPDGRYLELPGLFGLSFA